MYSKYATKNTKGLIIICKPITISGELKKKTTQISNK